MKKERKERIDELLERYFEARATEAEESELRGLLHDGEPVDEFPTEVRLLFGGLEALSAERMPEPAAGREIPRPAPVRTLMRRISPWWGVAAAAVVAVGVFLCAGWLREPYCYIDGRPVYDREVAMQATAYFDAFATLGSSERMVEDLMESL